MTSTKWWPSYERQELRLVTRNLIPTSGASLVYMTQREIPSNCGNLHNSALYIWCFQCGTLGGLRALGNNPAPNCRSSRFASRKRTNGLWPIPHLRVRGLPGLEGVRHDRAVNSSSLVGSN